MPGFARSSTLVYSLQNIRALAAPIGAETSQLSRIRGYVEQIEQLPHCYISPDIDLMELRSALRCFEANKEYEPIDPYVPRFDYVFPGFADRQRLIYPLWDVVRDLWEACPQIFGPQLKAHKLQALAMAVDRDRPQTGRSRVAVPPSEPIIEFLVLKTSVTRERAAEIASWIAAVPSRCPGLRVIRAVGTAMSQNRHYLARRDDVFDMSETMAIPYVDAATVDRTMLDYFSRATRALINTGSTPNENFKVFRSLADLLKELERSR